MPDAAELLAAYHVRPQWPGPFDMLRGHQPRMEHGNQQACRPIDRHLSLAVLLQLSLAAALLVHRCSPCRLALSCLSVAAARAVIRIRVELLCHDDSRLLQTLRVNGGSFEAPWETRYAAQPTATVLLVVFAASPELQGIQA